MNFLYSLLHFAITLFASLLLVRAHCWTMAVSPRDPMVNFVWRTTNWLINPLYKVIRPRNNVDWTSWTAVILVALVQVVLMRLMLWRPVDLIGFVIVPIANILSWSLNLISFGVLVYCILSFFGPNTRPVQSMLEILLAPFLRPVRRVIPRLGNFDLSPILIFLVIAFLLAYIEPVARGFFVL